MHTTLVMLKRGLHIALAPATSSPPSKPKLCDEFLSCFPNMFCASAKVLTVTFGHKSSKNGSSDSRVGEKHVFKNGPGETMEGTSTSMTGGDFPEIVGGTSLKLLDNMWVLGEE
jgi:hypothetical protein